MIALALAHSLAAHAAPSPAETPDVSVDLLRPAVEARSFIGLDDPRVYEGLGASVLVGHAQDPLVWEPDAGERVAVVGGATSAWLVAAWGRGPLRVGASMPAYLRVDSDVEGPRGTALGDASLDLKLSSPGLQDRPWALAVTGRVLAPTGDADLGVGLPGWGGDLGAVADLRVGRWTLLGNLSARLARSSDLGGVDSGPGARVGAGAAFSATERLSVQAEAFSQQAWSSLLRFDAPPPSELLTSAAWRTAGGTLLRGGVGAGLSAGPGSPRWRLVLSAGQPPQPTESAGDDTAL